MAFPTSFVVHGASGSRRRVLVCYHGSDPRSDEPQRGHEVPYTFLAGDKFLHVGVLWQKHGWGRRGKQLPVCPRHRVSNDSDWAEEKA